LGALISAGIISIYPPAGEQATITGQITGEPIWLPEIIAGMFLGMLLYRRIASPFALLAWLPPAVFLSWSALSWHRTMAAYDSTWDTYFGKNCGGSECLYELLLTMPFYAAVGYSVGALFSGAQKARQLEPKI
jgi:hypothetical protein